MPLQGRVCRLTATPLPSHIWIGDDVLNQAFQRWAQRCVGRRQGSAIPGPLEARKRTTKRRIMDLRPLAGGLDLHPGFLTGLDLGQENQQSWQWQPPTPPRPQDSTTSRSSGEGFSGYGLLRADLRVDVALPPWMMAPEAAEDEASSNVNVGKSSTINDSDMQEAILVEATKGELQQRPRLSPITQILQSEGLDDMRKIIGKIRVEKQALRRKCSITAFEQLLRSGRDMDKILEFLGDRVLNQRGARNLTFFVAHCLEASEVEDMRVLCKWVARQLYVGRYSDSALLTILQSLFNIRHQGEWQSVLDEFCKSVVQTLQLSPVIRTEYLEPKTWSSFVGVLFHDSYSEEMVDIGLHFLKSSSAAQLDRLAELIWPIIEHWIESWNPLKIAKLSPETLTSKIISLLQLLPLPRLIGTVTAISWRFLDITSSKGDFRTFWQKHSIWWSAVRSPDAFPYIRKSDSWLEIARALRRRQDEDIASLAVMEIQNHLEEGNLRAAYRVFMRSPQVLLDQCPNLAEALILDSENNAKAALESFHNQRSTAFSEVQSTSESYPLKQLRQDRIDLLERMALAYAKMSHTRPSFAFRCVYDCWSFHKRDKLGPIRPGMARALIESGIVRPLQSGRRLVSEARLEWILLQVAEAEGKEVMRKLGAAIWQWRDDVIWQMDNQRNTKRRGAIEQQWHEQRAAQLEPDRWDTLKSPASVNRKASPKGQEYLEHPSVDYDTVSPSATIGQWNRAQQSEGVTSYRSFPEQAFPWSPEIEAHGENNEHDNSFHGFPGIDSSSSTTPGDDVWDSLEQDHTDKETLALPSETSNYAAQYLSHDSARKQTIKFRALGTTQQRTAIPAGSSTLLESLSMLAAPKIPDVQVTNQPGQVNAIGALLEKLNSAARIGVQRTVTLGPDHSINAVQEFPSIPPCSLGAAIASNPRTADCASGEHEERGLTIRRVVGTGPVHGTRDAEEPSTLSTAMQPALGVGVAMDLSTRAWKARDKSEGLGFWKE
ncbi:MAG: hypothetical protein Q9188_003763 [Gyalolechia gomerana]